MRLAQTKKSASQPLVRRRISARVVWAVTDRADRRRGPRTGDVERQAGGVLGFLASRVRLDRVDAQSPTLGDELDEPAEVGGHAMAGHHAPLDLSAAVGERQRNVDLVERRSAKAQVSLNVNRPATAAAQRLLEVDAENGAIRRFD